MFQPWRLKVREAELAFENGQLDDASRLLSQPNLREFQPARKLLAKVADQYVRRAERKLDDGENQAAWRDLDQAGELGVANEAVAKVRQAMTDRGLAEAERYLAAGEPVTALARLNDLVVHGARRLEIQLLKDTAGKFELALELARKGQFHEAERELAGALELSPNRRFLEAARVNLKQQAETCRDLTENLHAAIGKQDWTAALGRAEAILEICPKQEVALRARRQAWAKVGLADRARSALADGRVGPEQRPRSGDTPRPQPMSRSTHSGAKEADPGLASPLGTPMRRGTSVSGSRFLMWVDGVGGFLVLEGTEVTIGQPVAEAHVDIPILGDVSRTHAKIRRDGEGYLIEAFRPTRVEGRSVVGLAALGNGAQIELGHGVKLKFHKPHALSATARLEFVSRHRTLPPVDGVILMADSCILGPGATSHVVARNWPSELVLFKQGQQLACRSRSPLTIDGALAGERGIVHRSSRIVAEDFSVCLEQL